jgi:hypothetical protein
MKETWQWLESRSAAWNETRDKTAQEHRLSEIKRLQSAVVTPFPEMIQWLEKRV